MKKVIAAALSILLIVGTMPVALAEDIAPVRVSTLEELQEAIADAESGDTICVTRQPSCPAIYKLAKKGKALRFAGQATYQPSYVSKEHMELKKLRESQISYLMVETWRLAPRS